MASRLEQLAQKRRDLQLQCALQRQQIGHLNANIEARLATADRIIGVVSSVTRNPAALIGTLAATLIIGPWRILKWASQGAMAYKIATGVRNLIR